MGVALSAGPAAAQTLPELPGTPSLPSTPTVPDDPTDLLPDDPTGGLPDDPTGGGDPTGGVEIPALDPQAPDAQLPGDLSGLTTAPTVIPGREQLLGRIPQLPDDGSGETTDSGDTGGSGTTAQKPVNTTPPQLSGGNRVGQTLACTRGTWSNNPTTYYAGWLRDGQLIQGQNQLSYKVQSADVGKKVGCVIVARNSAGDAAAPSSQTTARNTTTPVVSEDTVAPRVTGFRASPRSFKLGKGKTTLRWRQSEAGQVKIVLERKVVSKKGKVTWKRVGSLTLVGKKGANGVPFAGKVGERMVKPALYRATLTATDAASNASKPRTAKFTLRLPK